MSGSFEISVVVSTRNRCRSLMRALEALLDQTGAPPYEVLVVDNGSTDGTRDAVARLQPGPGGAPLIYVHEPRPGLSHARNTGISHARAPVVAFTDDDVAADRGWVAAIARAFARFPDASYVGGRVLPDWSSPPAWLTPAHWSPLALQDHGGDPFVVDATRPICLVGANMAFRASAFADAGLFSAHVQLKPGTVGSTEDHELMRRVWARGGHGRYVPDIVVRASVQPERLTRAYHRRWHYEHGRSHARMWLPDMERSRVRPLGVPGHVLRQGAGDAAALLRHVASGDRGGAFAAESRLWFAAGFVRERVVPAATPSPPPLDAFAADPLVSIVIPCYRQAGYLGEAIESALAQTYDRVEVLVVDDGSPDGAAEIAARYEGVRCLRQENRGLAHARNAGFLASRGDAVIFLDADDRLAPDAVAIGVAALAADPRAAMAFGRARVISATGELMFTAPREAVPARGDDVYLALLGSNVVWTPAVAIVRRDGLEACGLFDPLVGAAADYDLCLRIARHFPGVSHGAVVADYRHHETAMSRDAAAMLRASLEVHGRQRRHTRTSPARRRAFRDGRRFWKRFYGDQLMDRIRHDRARGAARAAFAGLAAMARHAPGRLAWHLLGSLRRIARALARRDEANPHRSGSAANASVRTRNTVHRPSA